MRWLMTPNGERAHAFIGGVTPGLTMCGMRIVDETRLAPEDTERCGNCDKEWRRRGRETKRTVKKPARTAEYRPRHTFADWDK